jgi:hypothetical protein
MEWGEEGATLLFRFELRASASVVLGVFGVADRSSQ